MLNRHTALTEQEKEGLRTRENYETLLSCYDGFTLFVLKNKYIR